MGFVSPPLLPMNEPIPKTEVHQAYIDFLKLDLQFYTDGSYDIYGIDHYERSIRVIISSSDSLKPYICSELI